MIHKKIGFIGAGNISQSMIRALIDNKVINNKQIYITNRSLGKLKKVQDIFSINVCSNNKNLIEECEIVVAAVRPQDLLDMLETVADAFHNKSLLISVAAGVSIESLQKIIKNT